MKIEEIKRLLKDEGEDKAMIAVKHLVSVRFIDMLLSGQRSLETETAQEILTDLEALAKINKAARRQKQTLLAAIS